MVDERLPQVEPIRSPWRERLAEALLYVQHSLLIVGPYIKDDVISLLKNTLEARLAPQLLNVRVITRVLPDDFQSGASDISALQHLLMWPAKLAGSSIEMRAINNLHAKIWVFDTNLAMVGSGNATFSGLETNLEYGLAVSDPQLVERILQDWQEWWEQASPIQAKELEQLCQWLEALASDAEIRKAEKMVQEKRQAAERRIGTAPLIGKRLVVTRGTRPGKNAFSDQAKSYAVSPPPGNLHAPEPQPELSHPLLARTHVSASRLWHALRWTTGVTDSETQPFFVRGTFLKIATRSTSEGQQTLQCMWADGYRISQATIQGHTRETRLSWTITIGESAIQQLVDYLRHIFGSGERALEQLSSEHELVLWWQSSPSYLYVSQASEHSIPVAISCMPAVLQGNIRVPRPPLSQITVEQTMLMKGLTTLKQQWETLLHADFPVPATIELSFGSLGGTPSMTLAIGPIDAPLVLSVAGRDCVLSGPEIKLRLDFSSFQHVIASSQGMVHDWLIQVGRDAEAVQFIPQFDDEMAWGGSFEWMHELRDLAGG